MEKGERAETLSRWSRESSKRDKAGSLINDTGSLLIASLVAENAWRILSTYASYIRDGSKFEP